MLLKKYLFLCIILSSLSLSSQDDWFNSLNIAQKLALRQNKMLFVMWEASTEYDFPVVLDAENNTTIHTDLFRDDDINDLIWEYFVPVKLPEDSYESLFNAIKDKRSPSYIKRFQDEGIKIMDANGNILNTGYVNTEEFNFSKFIKRYGLNTEFVAQQLINYSTVKDLGSSFNLASKYYDYALFVGKQLKKEIIELANIYLSEAEQFLAETNIPNKAQIKQTCDFLRIKQYLVLNKPRKVLRLLKKVEPPNVDPKNESLYAALYYTAYKLLDNEKEANLWKTKVSLVDLKKADLIIKHNL